MISLAHLATLTEYAARNSGKLVLAGDQEQLAAVEGGGAMTLLADKLGYVQLTEPVRFTAAWNAPPRYGCAPGMPPRWTNTTSTAASAAPHPTRPWTRPSAPTSPATWPAGMSC